MVFLCHTEVCVSLKYGAPTFILFYNLNKDFSVLYLNVIRLCTRTKKINNKKNPNFCFVDTEVKSPVFARSIRIFRFVFVSSVLHRVDISRLLRVGMVDTLLRVILLISHDSLSSELLTVS